MADSANRRIFVNAGPIAHFSAGDVSKPLVGTAMSSDEQIHVAGMAFVVESGIFTTISTTEQIISEYGHDSATVDLGGHAIVPGYIDAHTHLIWDGDRSNELRMRQSGMSYSDIANAGGGIRHTVEQTRNCTDADLRRIGKSRLDIALNHGTTSIEVKSGYGLNTKSEMAILDAYMVLNEMPQYHGMNFPTWMGAHDIPHGWKRSDYVEHLISEQLPEIGESGLALNVDVFCEPGWFTLEDTENICRAATEEGLEIRLHVDEFCDGEGLQLAAELGAVTADHAIHSTDDARAAAAEAGVLQGFLPGTPYIMGSEKWPPIQKCIDEEWPWTLASDFNPNCPTLSLPMAGSLVTHRLNIDPIATLAAVTRNAATGLPPGLQQQGVITEGAVANFNQLNSMHIESWCQSPGHHGIKNTFIRGNMIKR
jgi:imidazolonepropionase